MSNSLLSAKTTTVTPSLKKLDDDASTKTATGSKSKSETNSTITLNEAFFSDQSNALNPKLNPLISNKQTKPDKIVSYTNDANKLPIESATSLAVGAESATTTFTLPPLLAANNTSPISRDGFVTNHRYQTLKDNKRNEAQVTNCYDEVYEADQNVGDDDAVDEDEESTDLDSKSLPSSSASSDDSDENSIELETKKMQEEKSSNSNKPVVINMMSSSGEGDEDFDDDDEDTNEYGEKYGEKMKKEEEDIGMSTATSKYKFENLLRQVETEGKPYSC